MSGYECECVSAYWGGPCTCDHLDSNPVYYESGSTTEPAKTPTWKDSCEKARKWNKEQRDLLLKFIEESNTEMSAIKIFGSNRDAADIIVEKMRELKAIVERKPT